MVYKWKNLIYFEFGLALKYLKNMENVRLLFFFSVRLPEKKLSSCGTV